MKDQTDSKKYKLNEKDLKLRFLYEDLRRRKFDTQSRFLLQSVITITILSSVVFSSLLLFNPNDRKDIFLFPFSTKNTDKEDIESLRRENSQLQKSVSELQHELTEFKNQPSDDKDVSLINTKLDNFSVNLDVLNETILEQPDTAITAKLLREAQKTLDQKVDDLIKDQQRIEDKVDNFLSNLIAVPVFAALAGLVFTVIAAIITPIFFKIKDKFIASNDKTGLDESL